MIKIKKPSHIIVGLSGGVDSSVSAFLLKEAGHHVEAIFMKNWEADENDLYCTQAKDLEDAEAVCELLNIDLHVVNFSAEYWKNVFSYFLTEYQKARTPNPDILCNKEIKFKAFLDYAKNRGADYIATGHYVRNKEDARGYHLLKGNDPAKDQSYFLHALTESQIRQSVFPVGDLTKQEVRALAQKIGLKNATKKDSTGICFIGERKFKTFLEDYLPANPGQVVTLEGDVVGLHDGLMFYTIGQRQGLKIGGKKGRSEAAWYVAAKDLVKNTLVVVQEENHPALFKKSLIATHLHWINEAPSFPFQVKAKTRYRQVDQDCTIEPEDGENFQVTFTHPQRAITPGQAIVFYQDDICLGGGIIDH